MLRRRRMPPVALNRRSPLLCPAPWQAIYPVEYEGVKAVSFGFAGQGSAIMRGPMVSGACVSNGVLGACVCEKGQAGWRAGRLAGRQAGGSGGMPRRLHGGTPAATQACCRHAAAIGRLQA